MDSAVSCKYPEGTKSGSAVFVQTVMTIMLKSGQRRVREVIFPYVQVIHTLSLYLSILFCLFANFQGQ